jgi:flavin-dependent dehydrogenase
VELRLGWTVEGLLREGGAFAGVAGRDVAGGEDEVTAPLVVGADGRDSTLAELAGVAEKRRPHGRFVYAAYYEGPGPRGAPDVSTWFMDPQWAIAAPTDEGLVLYAVMPTKDRLPEFKQDPARALDSFLAQIPDGPPIAESRRVGALIGKIDMTNRVRGPVAPGLALVGDAALATDPLFGVGCGWALQSAEWLADSVIPAVLGKEPLGRGLTRYRRRRLRELRGHAYFIHDYASGRRLGLSERMIFAAAARDPKVAGALDAVATRRAKPIRTIARVMPRVLAANVSPSRLTAPSGT